MKREMLLSRHVPKVIISERSTAAASATPEPKLSTPSNHIKRTEWADDARTNRSAQRGRHLPGTHHTAHHQHRHRLYVQSAALWTWLGFSLPAALVALLHGRVLEESVERQRARAPDLPRPHTLRHAHHDNRSGWFHPDGVRFVPTPRLLPTSKS